VNKPPHSLLTLADTILLVFAVGLVVSLYLTFWQNGEANFAEVRNHSQQTKRFNLSQNQHIDIEGPLGHSQLQINNNKIRFVSSPCHNKLCVRSGWLEHNGEAAACLPNRVSVRLASNKQRITFDAINF